MNNPTANPSCCSCCPQRCIRLCGCGPNENGLCGGSGRCSRFCIPCSKFMKIPKFCQRKSHNNNKNSEKEVKEKSRSQSSEHEIHSSKTDVAAKNNESCWRKLNCCCRKGNQMDSQKVNIFFNQIKIFIEFLDLNLKI